MIPFATILEAKLFKMDATIGTSNMHLFDKDGKIKHYSTPHEIISEFCEVRLALYVKRKEALEAAARAEEPRAAPPPPRSGLFPCVAPAADLQPVARLP